MTASATIQPRLRTLLLGLLMFEVLALAALRVGLGASFGLALAVAVAASVVASVLMVKQLGAFAFWLPRAAAYIVSGRWRISLVSLLVAVALVQLLIVGLLKIGTGVSSAVGAATGTLAAYLIWPSVSAQLRRIGSWCADNINLSGRVRYSTRGLLVATAGMAVVCAWIGADLRTASQELDVVNRLEEHGAQVVYDVRRRGDAIEPDRSSGSPSLVKRVQGAGGANVHYVILNPRFVRMGERADKITDACTADLAALTKLRVLDLRGTAITDAGLSRLDNLPELELLLVTGTPITDAGVQEFEELHPNCEVYR